MADGMLDRLGASLRALVGVYGPNAGTQAYGLLTGILPGGRGELSPRGTTEFLKAYSESPWLRAVVQKVAHGVASTEWQLYVETTKPPGRGPAPGKAPPHPPPPARQRRAPPRPPPQGPGKHRQPAPARHPPDARPAEQHE